MSTPGKQLKSDHGKIEPTTIGTQRSVNGTLALNASPWSGIFLSLPDVEIKEHHQTSFSP